LLPASGPAIINTTDHIDGLPFGSVTT
jgi:hypothetical protein